MIAKKKISKKQLIGYGAAGIGDSASYCFISSFLMFFLTSIAGVSTVNTGFIVLFGGIWNTVFSPAIGFISDKFPLKYGRRRPYMLIGAFLIVVMVTLLFTTIDGSLGMKTIYYSFMTVLFWTGFSIFFIPYLAFGAELTKDYDERTLLRSCTFAFNEIGMLIGLVAPTSVVAFLCAHGASQTASWQKAGIIVGCFSMLSILFSWHTTRGSEVITAEAKPGKQVKSGHLNILKEYRQILQLKPLIYLIAGSIIFLAANTLMISGRMYYVTYHMGLNQSKITLVYLFFVLIGIATVPLVIKTSKLIGKRETFISAVLISSAAAFYFGFKGIGSMREMFIYLYFMGFGNSSYWQLFPSMIYDVCEVDEFVNGKRREGIIVSLQSLAEALSQALTVLILSFILNFSGFNGAVRVQEQTALNWIQYSITFLPAAIMLLSAAAVFLYPLTKARFHLLISALDQKKKEKLSPPMGWSGCFPENKIFHVAISMWL